MKRDNFVEIGFTDEEIKKVKMLREEMGWYKNYPELIRELLHERFNLLKKEGGQ